MKSWYKIEAKANQAAEISIYDEIGMWGINASDFKNDFDAVKSASRLTLYLNTPGGNVFDGMAIYNMLAGVRDKLSVEVMGVAASIGSVIALAGSDLKMAEGTYLMIHNPWAVAVGDASAMLSTADLLEKMQGQFANIYESQSNLSRDEALAVMQAETWYTAEEAAQAGFVEEVIEYEELAAMSFDFAKFGYARIPDEMSERAERSDPETWREFEAYLRDVGMSRTEAKRTTATAMKVEQRDVAEQQIAEETPEPEQPEDTASAQTETHAFRSQWARQAMQEALAQ